MVGESTGEGADRSSLRLWPGVVIVLLQWLLWVGAPYVDPGTAVSGFTSVIGGWVGGLGVLVWWAFFSRAPRLERWGAPALMLGGILATPFVLHESIATGNVGMQFYIYVVPVLSLAFVVWAVAARGLADAPRRATMVVAILAGTAGLALLRSDGLTSAGAAQLAFRWAPTAEDRLLERGPEKLAAPPAAARAVPAAADVDVDWPGFRGPGRDATLPGVRIATDWSTSPPVELWRRAVGPGTASFAVGGGLLYTQEQRGDDELVAAYRLDSGEPVWRHRYPARYSDSYVGAGPRGTPALAAGRVYALGATGILNALDARDGGVLWSRNAASDSGAEIQMWGFTSSPLVIDDAVLAYTDRLAAYDLETGELRWSSPATGGGYGSPQLLTVGGVGQVLVMTDRGPAGFSPADGSLLWEHSWPGIGIVQPAVLEGPGSSGSTTSRDASESHLLISMIDHMAMPLGARRIVVRHGADGWSTEERWTSNRLKLSFSSPVVHGGYAYGFDGHILACIDVATGERAWKGGRYGHGQLVLLPDQDLLLVLTERGDLALVSATPDGFRELGRAPAIEGKTWSHPALVGDVLLVRNGEEMAAFRLARAES